MISPTCCSRSSTAGPPTCTSPQARLRPCAYAAAWSRWRASRPHADRHARDRLLDPVRGPAPEVREQLAARLRLPDPGAGALPRQRLHAALGGGCRAAPDPVRRGAARAPRPAARRRRVRQQAARPGPGDRPHRLGQVDHAGLADRRDQRHARGAHHDGGGSDRVPAPAQEVHRQPARARAPTPPASPRRSRPRFARTPT